MRNKIPRLKMVGLLFTGAMMFQFGGCSLNGLLSQASIGFARQIGAIPAQAVYDLTVGPLIDGAITAAGRALP